MMIINNNSYPLVISGIAGCSTIIKPDAPWKILQRGYEIKSFEKQSARDRCFNNMIRNGETNLKRTYWK